MLNEVILSRIVRGVLREYIEEASGDYYESLPTDYAYRYGARQEYDDALANGFRSQNSNSNYVAPKSKDAVSKSGRRFSLCKKQGQSHGGKAFAKGEPWHGSHLKSDDEVIMGVPGNNSRWKTGFHGNYSEDYYDFDDIEHGKPLYVPYDDDGNTSIRTDGMRAWRQEGNGYREL